MNYYNEIDPSAAKWLHALIEAELIPHGHVDTRSITEVTSSDLEGYIQCHFFAGIAGWSYALDLAKWPRTRRVWTGSCPCQPFSVGGDLLGYEDARHLWPSFYRLVKKSNPDVIFGEQVASAIELGWLDGVSANLEAENYAVGSVVLGAHSVSAPHIRQRLYWVADSCREGLQGHQQESRILVPERTPLSLYGYETARTRDVLEGTWHSLLLDDGIPLQLVKRAVKCYGNAIVPQAAAEFIKAFKETQTTRIAA